MNKRRVCFRVLVLVTVLSLSVPVYASEMRDPGVTEEELGNEVDESQTEQFETTSPWLKGNEDETIYSNPLDGSDELSSQIEPDTPGQIEKAISGLLRNIASAIIQLLDKYLGASLDSIVYGRVGSGYPNRVNIFTFELRKGNPYGVTGAVAYTVLRSIAYIFMALQFIWTLAKASFSGYTGKSREEIKSRFYTLIMNFCLLALMPFFLDLALYLRDVVLYGLKEVTSQLITGGGSFNLSDTFYIVSENSGSFIDAVMYMGTVVLTIYFVCIYVSIALDMLLCFVIFPITCVLNRQGRSALEAWGLSVLSDLCTPVLDAILLLVPLLTSVMLSDVISGVQIIQLLMCMLIIPLRGQLKEKLGLSRGGERNGMFGAMAGLAAGRLLGSRIKAGASRIKEAVQDAKRSRLHGEMADLDKEEEESLLAGYSSLRAMPAGEKGRTTDKEEKFRGGIQSAKKDSSGEESGASYAEAAEGKEDMDRSVNDWRQEHGNSDTEEYHEPFTREEAARELEASIDAKEDEIAAMREEKAGYLQREKEQRLAMLNTGTGSEDYKKAQQKAAEYALKASEVDKHIQSASRQLSHLRRQEERISSTGLRGRRVSDFDVRRAKLLEQQADINNFEQPEFKGVLSNARLKELYRARAIRSGAQAAAGVAGAVGGGVLAGSLASFTPPSTAMVLSAGGVSVGSSIGEAGVSAVSDGIRILKRSQSIVESPGPVMQYTRVSVEEIPGGNTGISGNRKQEEIHISENFVATEESLSSRDEETSENFKTIQIDAVRALNRMVNGTGDPKNSRIVKALKDANLQVEAYLAAIDEESRAGITQEMEQSYRIEAQTEKIVDTILEHMVLEGRYEKGSAAYRYAKEFLLERVEKIVEEKNQSLL